MDLDGIYPAIVTPFNADGNVDFKAFGRLLDFVIERGVSGIVPCGSTGEFYALTGAEFAEVLSFVKEAVDGRVRLVAGTNATSTAAVVANSRLAKDLGYDAIMLAPPYYSLPTPQEVVSHFKTVLSDVDIPLVLYNYPGRAGVEIGYDVLDAIVEHPNVIGIKESSGDISRLHGMLVRYEDRIQIVCGGDDQALEYFAWGVKGWIGGASCYVPQQHVAVLKAANAGDFSKARSAMAKLLPLLQNMESGQYTQKAKYGCELAGCPVGQPRPPLLPLSDAEKRDFAGAYERATSK